MTTKLAPTPIRWLAPDDTTPAPSRALPWSGFLQLVATVEQAGYAPPPQYGELLKSYTRIQAAAVTGGTMQRRLTEAVLRGDAGDDLEMLFVGALSERHGRGSELQAGLLGEIRGEVLDALRRVYAEVAAGHYSKLRDRFNSAADKFTRCARVIDPAAAPNQVIDLKPKQVEAWRQAETHANELEALMEPLSCAAELLRPLEQPSGIGNDRNPFLLPLVADVTDLHRRLAWAAWTDMPMPKPPGPLTHESLEAAPPKPLETRGGKWSRLLGVGAEIRAAADPSSVELYDPAQPIGVRLEQPAPGKRPVLMRFDPEGDINAPRRLGPLDVLRQPLAAFRRRNDVEEIDLLDTISDAQ
jgi:hypothetical protein